MKYLALAACSVAAIVLAAGCVARPRTVTTVTTTTSYGPNDAYYDAAYGPYSSGYWANDGYFYYNDGTTYRRDDARHFRRDEFTGAVVVRGTVAPHLN